MARALGRGRIAKKYRQVAAVCPAARLCYTARVRHRYPFEALHWLRRQRVDREATLVRERVARTVKARGDEARAAAIRSSTERQIDELSRAEQARLEQGSVRVGELSQVGEWRRAAELDLQAKAEREQQAKLALCSEMAAESVARRQLGVASNEAELLGGHRLDWRAECEAAEERSEEEAAVEQWTARRYPGRA